MNSVNKILVYVLLLGFITSCSKKQDTKSGSEVSFGQTSVSQKEKVKITFLNEDLIGKQKEVIESQLKKFAKENPDIEVKLMTYRPGTDKVLVMIAGNVAPDIFFINRVDIPAYISKGALLNITPYIAKSKIIKETDFFPATLVTYRWNGKKIGEGDLYGLPKDFSPDAMLFYNKDLFDKAGVPYPSSTESLPWDKFIELAKKLTKTDSSGRIVQYGVYMGASLYPMFIESNGGKLFSDDQKRCLIDSKECVEAIRAVTDLALKHKVCPPIQVTRDVDPSIMFRTEKLAMSFFGRWSVPNFREELKFRWGVAPAPHLKKRVNIMYGPNGFAIYKNTKYPEQVFRLLEFLVGPDHQRAMGRLGWNIPTNKIAAYSKDFLDNPEHPEGINKIFIDEEKYTIPAPSNPYINFWRMLTEAENEIYMYYTGRCDLETALKRAAERINRIIDEEVRKSSK